MDTQCRYLVSLLGSNGTGLGSSIVMGYGLIGQLAAHPDRRDELADLLVTAASRLGSDSECLLYIVALSAEPDGVWITEVWTTKQAHDASLQRDEIRELIQRAMPLVASVSEQREFQVLGGKGL